MRQQTLSRASTLAKQNLHLVQKKTMAKECCWSLQWCRKYFCRCLWTHLSGGRWSLSDVQMSPSNQNRDHPIHDIDSLSQFGFLAVQSGLQVFYPLKRSSIDEDHSVTCNTRDDMCTIMTCSKSEFNSSLNKAAQYQDIRYMFHVSFAIRTTYQSPSSAVLSTSNLSTQGLLFTRMSSQFPRSSLCVSVAQV